MDATQGSSAAVWDAVASSYDQRRASDAVYAACCAAVLRRAAPISVDARVLDAGCGTGLVAIHVAKRTPHLTAVDYSANSLSVLAEKLQALRLGAELMQGDIRSLPFPDEHFDVVICANTLQHLAPDGSQQAAVSELLRVLRRGGRYAFSVHHFSRSKRAAGWIKEGKPGEPGIDYIYRYTCAELQALAPSACISTCGFNSMCRLGVNAQLATERLLGPTLARAGFGHMLVAHGTKGRTAS